MTEQDLHAYRGTYFARGLITFLMNAALVTAPAFLGGLAVFFVVEAFTGGLGIGMRSFAAVIFPLMVLAFVKAGRTSIPIVELILATGFSFIVYVLSEGRDRAAPYCLGLVIGSLGYVIVIGVPQL